MGKYRSSYDSDTEKWDVRDTETGAKHGDSHELPHQAHTAAERANDWDKEADDGDQSSKDSV